MRIYAVIGFLLVLALFVTGVATYLNFLTIDEALAAAFIVDGLAGLTVIRLLSRFYYRAPQPVYAEEPHQEESYEEESYEDDYFQER